MQKARSYAPERAFFPDAKRIYCAEIEVFDFIGAEPG
jgi:hypothetical protein